MSFFRKLLLMICLLALAAVFVTAAPALAEQDADMESQVTVTTESDSLVAQLFMNMVSRAVTEGMPEDGSDWVDPSLAEYPADPHERAEYGDSPRLRVLEKGSENWLVYRDTILLIPREEAGKYTLTWSDDKRTATLTPAVPQELLAGKSGIALLGDTAMDDRILVFEGEPARNGGSMTVTLADPETMPMNRVFSDGEITFDPTAQETEGVKLRGAAAKGALRGIQNPLHKSLSGTNWSGRVYDFLPDFGNCDLDTDISIKPWSFRFNVVLTLATKGKFDLTSTGATGSRETREVGSVTIPLPANCALNISFSMEVQFDSTPVHVEGTIRNSIGWSFGVGPAYLKDFTCDIDYTKFEVGREGAYFTEPEQYANRPIDLYIGSKFVYEGGFLEWHIPIVDVTIGPVISIDFTATAGAATNARWEADVYEPDTFDRTAPDVHFCAETGKPGCLSVRGNVLGKYQISGNINIYVKKWKIPFIKVPEGKLKDLPVQYNSLTEGTGLRPGDCPNHWYRIPVQVWLDRIDGTPADGFTVYPGTMMSQVPEERSFFCTDVTGNGGRAAIYLPWKPSARYAVTASALVDGVEKNGFAFQPSDMVRGENSTVHIELGLADYATRIMDFLVYWHVDEDMLDIPQSVDAEVQYWDGERWTTFRDGNGPMQTTIVRDERQRASWQTFFRVPMYGLVNGRIEALQTRIRLLDAYGTVIHDGYDDDLQPGEEPCAYYVVPDAMSRTGELITEHDTKYHASYLTRMTASDIFRTTVDLTAVYDAHLYKRWVDVPEEERPEEVYLGLVSRPQAGWPGAGDVWTLVTDPLGGDTVTLAELSAVGELADLNLAHIPVRGVAVAEVCAENGWSAGMAVPKYRDGIPQDFMAMELNAAIVDRLMMDEYAIGVTVQMDDHDYVSLPAVARTVYRDYTLSAVVINTREDVEDAARHTVGGTKYWVPDSDEPSYPEEITLHVWELDNLGNSVREVAAVTLSAPGEGATVTERVMWPWVLYDETIDNEQYTYTVTEEYPREYTDAARYFTRIFGTDVVNEWRADVSPLLRVVKVWDREYIPEVDEWQDVDVTLSVGGETRPLRLTKEMHYMTAFSLDRGMTPERAAAELSIEEDLAGLQSRTGLTFIPVYSSLDVKIVNEVPVYTLAVTNVFQINRQISLLKRWWLGYGGEGYDRIPERIRFVVRRDGEIIIEKTFDKPAEREGRDIYSLGMQVFDRDGNGNILKRADANGHVYTYTVEEEPFPGMLDLGSAYQTEGFVSELSLVSHDLVSTNTAWMDTYSYINRWVVDGNNQNYVTLKGTKTWMDDDDAAGCRPDCIMLSIIDHHDRLVKQIEVTAADGWAWNVPGLPRYEKDSAGNQTEVMYYVVESEVDGYTAAYSADFDEETMTWSNWDEEQGWTNYDAETRTWTCDVTNYLTGYYQMKVKKEIGGTAPEGDLETFRFKVEPLTGPVTSEREFPMPRNMDADGCVSITGAGETTLDLLFPEDGIYLYRITEEKGENDGYIYDEHKWILLVVVGPKIGENGVVSATEKDIRSYIMDADEEGDATDEDGGEENGDGEDGGEAYDPFDEEDAEALSDIMTETDTLTFTNKIAENIKVKKTWDVDIEGKDHPDTIEILIQEKDGDKWKTVKLVELGKTKDEEGNEEVNWEKELQLPKYRTKEGTEDEQEKIEYRVRELSPENGLLKKLQDLLNGYAGQAKEKFDEWKNGLIEQGKSWYDSLPEDIRNAADQGYDKLAEKLNATEDDLYGKLLEKMQFYSAEKRIVYDEEDDDKPKKENEDDEEPETNIVTYEVPKYTSVMAGGEEDEHETTYKVSYGKDDDTYTIKNTAITVIDVTKRWIFLGGNDDKEEEGEESGSSGEEGDDDDDDDRPDHAWMVLLFKFAPGVLENEQLGSLADSAGIDISSLTNIELPAFHLVEGGMNPIEFLGEVTVGVNLDFLGLADGFKIGVAKVDEDGNWNAHFVDKKYTFGLPVEYKGAELTSEILRQLVKYIFHVDLFLSYNPFDNYISIPGKAYRQFTFLNVEDMKLDAKGAFDSLLEAGGKLLQGDIDSFDDLKDVFLDDSKLWANVFNVQITLPDIEFPENHVFTKHWVGDEEADRPDSITIHVKATLKDGTEVEQDVTLNKSDFEGEDDWEYDLDDLEIEGADEDSNPVEEFEVTGESFPEGYEHADDYEQQLGDLEIINSKKVPGYVSVSGRKVWKDDNDRDAKRPEEVTVQLYADGVLMEKDGEPVQAVVTKVGGWRYHFPLLPEFREGTEEKIRYTVKEVPLDADLGYTTTYVGNDIVNTREPEKIPEIKVKKVWDDEDDFDGFRPDKVTVKLMAATPTDLEGDETETPDGQESAATPTDLGEKNVVAKLELNADGGWEGVFTDLFVYDQGQEIEYTVDEEDVPRYGKEIEGDPESGFTVTNKHVHDTLAVSGEKIWEDEDNEDGLRPDSVTIQLWGNGSLQDTRSVSAADGWAYSFPNMPKRLGGKYVEYEIREYPVPDHYTASYSEPVTADDDTEEIVLNVTNRQAETVIAGRKYWDDANNNDGKRPQSVTVKLYGSDGSQAEPVETNAAKGWKYEFTVPKFDAGGQKITWTVSEDPIPVGYSMVVSGYDITNTYVPETVELYGEKTWDDDNDRDGRRPTQITVHLVERRYDPDTGEESEKTVATKTVTAEDHWQYNFGFRRKYDRRVPLTWYVTEDTFGRYRPVISGMNITNTYSPDTTTVSGEKSWDDGDDRDGFRPESITVNLTGTVPGGDGANTVVENRSMTVAPDGDGKWRYTFENLPVYYGGGKKIAYTVSEEPVSQYRMVISGYNITNVHVPDTRIVEGEKQWEDDDNAYGLRPSAMVVHLLADGKRIDSQTVTAQQNWKYRFYDLPLNDGGRRIDYTVEEEPVQDYSSKVDGFDVVNRPVRAKYTVEWYYQENGKYPETPNVTEVRTDVVGQPVSVTDADKEPARKGYYPDETAENVFSGSVLSDDSLVLKLYFRPEFIITYDPNGGRLAGSSKPVQSTHLYGDVITIREAAVREGYEFQYWEGSRYDPGDSYTVTGDHTFVAKWKREPGPYTTKFTFTKKWSGGHLDSIDWTLYDEDGRTVRKGFNKKVVSQTEWQYEAWFDTDVDYYIVEEVPAGYKVRYENTGVHADVTDRCYNGGTIINYRIPKTGDTTGTDMAVWILLMALGLIGVGIAADRIRRRPR